MAQGPSDTILVAIRITLRIRESKVRNPDPLDRRRFVLSEHSFLVLISDDYTTTSADAEKPLDAPQIRNIALEKACNRGTSFKDTQDHYNCCY